MNLVAFTLPLTSNFSVGVPPSPIPICDDDSFIIGDYHHLFYGDPPSAGFAHRPAVGF